MLIYSSLQHSMGCAFQFTPKSLPHVLTFEDVRASKQPEYMHVCSVGCATHVSVKIFNRDKFNEFICLNNFIPHEWTIERVFWKFDVLYFVRWDSYLKMVSIEVVFKVYDSFLNLGCNFMIGMLCKKIWR